MSLLRCNIMCLNSDIFCGKIFPPMGFVMCFAFFVGTKFVICCVTCMFLCFVFEVWISIVLVCFCVCLCW